MIARLRRWWHDYRVKRGIRSQLPLVRDAYADFQRLMAEPEK